MKGYWIKRRAEHFKHHVYPFGHVRVCDIKDWDDESYLAKSVRRQAVPERAGETTTCPLCLKRLITDQQLKLFQGIDRGVAKPLQYSTTMRTLSTDSIEDTIFKTFSIPLKRKP